MSIFFKTIFPKYLKMVNGISIIGGRGVTDEEIFHTADVINCYLTENEEWATKTGSEKGVLQTKLNKVKKHIKENKGGIMITKNEPKFIELFLAIFFIDINIQDLYSFEINPKYIKSGYKGRFDATLEEVLHMITDLGYAYAFPTKFSTELNSELGKYTKFSRGGNTGPGNNNYNENAYFTYDDETCDNNCMMTEYLYWIVTTNLGLQQNRLSGISHEWNWSQFEKTEEKHRKNVLKLCDEYFISDFILPSTQENKEKYAIRNNIPVNNLRLISAVTVLSTFLFLITKQLKKINWKIFKWWR